VGVQPAASGSWGSVVWAMDAVGKTSAKTFYSELKQKDRAKIQALFNALAEVGRIPTTEHFKKLGTGVTGRYGSSRAFRLGSLVHSLSKLDLESL
jgi:hypothetical protein